MIPDPDSLSVNFKPLRSGQIIQITVCLSKVLLIYLFKWSSYIQKIQINVWFVFASGIIVKKATEWCDPGEIWLTLYETDSTKMSAVQSFNENMSLHPIIQSRNSQADHSGTKAGVQ